MRHSQQESTPKRRRPVRSLRFQLTMILLFCYLIPVLILGVYTRVFLMNGMMRKTAEAVSSQAENAWTLVTQKIEQAVELARGATYDGELTAIQEQWDAEEIGDAEFLRQCRSYLDRKYIRESLFEMAVFFPVSRPELMAAVGAGSAGAMGGVEEMRQLRETMIALGEELDTQSRFIDFGGHLYLVRNLLNLRMHRYGMLALHVREDQVFYAMNRMSAEMNGQLSVQLDDWGATDVAWKELSPGLTDRDTETELWYVRQISDSSYDLRMLLRLDRMEQYREMYRYRDLTMVVFLLMIPVLWGLLTYVKRRIIRPVQLLTDAADRIEEGELGVTVPMHGGDELGDLGVAFSKMSLRLKELIDKTYKEEIELKNAQILALQSRINPHFINNALEEINWQARIDKSETISAMVSALSVLLNATMARKNRRIVPLREELEVVDAYVYFVQQRFGSDLTCRREIAEDAMDCTLPLLTVQPMMENGVEHGIAPGGGGELELRAFRHGEALRLEIRNTGQGIRPRDREKIDIALRGENAGPHLGLANIVNRLRLIYGERAVIEVETEEKWTVVRIDVPQDATEAIEPEAGREASAPGAM